MRFSTHSSSSPQAAIFPVDGSNLSAVEGAFGPRVQTSTGIYDWHRGIDIDGTLNVDEIIASLPGYFNRYEYSSSGGNTVVLEHRFADFLGGTVPSISYNGQTLTKFYTWHLHPL
jgi:murein DD-endopeptidase MepM/ murein hydrolase activator NlpD